MQGELPVRDAAAGAGSRAPRSGLGPGARCCLEAEPAQAWPPEGRASAWLARRPARFVLKRSVPPGAARFLCLKNKNSALVVFTTYTQKHPSIEGGPPFVQPLLNFIWFLLLALDG